MQLAFVSILVDEGRRAEPAKGTGTRKGGGRKKERKKGKEGRKEKRERTRLSNCEYAREREDSSKRTFLHVQGKNKEEEKNGQKRPRVEADW